jgi:hypothetical protein
MCDYSLAGVPNRLAVEGEQLVVHRFPTGTLGLASPCSQPLSKGTPAVCIPPGARLRLRDIPEALQLRFGLNATEEVTFVQLSAEAYQYRDAVRFQNGREILLQRLSCGQQVEVLSLASGDIPEKIPKKRHRWMEELYSRMFVG